MSMVALNLPHNGVARFTAIQFVGSQIQTTSAVHFYKLCLGKA